MRLLAIALSLAVSMTVVGAGAADRAAAVPATTKTQLQYIVIPHPDDEYEAWSLVEKSAGNYPVFLVMTHGEETSFYDGHGIDAQGYNTEYGERVPQPQPWSTKWSATLHNERLDSWHNYLNQMATFDAYLGQSPVRSDDSRAGLRG